MLTVAKCELKAKMSVYFRLVEQSGEELIVTDHGRSVLKVAPLETGLTVDQAFGDIRSHVVSDAVDAVLAPTAAEWETV